MRIKRTLTTRVRFYESIPKWNVTKLAESLRSLADELEASGEPTVLSVKPGASAYVSLEGVWSRVVEPEPADR